MNNAKSHQCQQVSWWSVREFVTPILERVGSWPMAGTPAWCDLDDDDPVKFAAVLDGGQHWALRVETCQQQQAEAAKDVSNADDWPAVAQQVQRGRGSAYIPREVA